VRENVTIGDFTIVGRGVAIENLCTIGRYCKLETNVYITAYSKLGDRVFVAPGALTSNDNFVGRTKERFKHFKGVTVERGGRIAAGAVVLPGKTVGANAVVAAGSVLTEDAPARKIVLGSPAKPVRDVPPEQLLDNQGFNAPYGPLTAERRHPQFRFPHPHDCQWNGPSWPFATTQTLVAMANLLNHYNQSFVDRQDYYDLLLKYATSQKKNLVP